MLGSKQGANLEVNSIQEEIIKIRARSNLNNPVHPEEPAPATPIPEPPTVDPSMAPALRRLYSRANGTSMLGLTDTEILEVASKNAAMNNAIREGIDAPVLKAARELRDYQPALPLCYAYDTNNAVERMMNKQLASARAFECQEATERNSNASKRALELRGQRIKFIRDDPSAAFKYDWN